MNHWENDSAENIQQLAEEGWMRMRRLLHPAHASFPVAAWGGTKRYYIFLAVAIPVLSVVLICLPLLLDDGILPGSPGVRMAGTQQRLPSLRSGVFNVSPLQHDSPGVLKRPLQRSRHASGLPPATKYSFQHEPLHATVVQIAKERKRAAVLYANTSLIALDDAASHVKKVNSHLVARVSGPVDSSNKIKPGRAEDKKEHAGIYAGVGINVPAYAGLTRLQLMSVYPGFVFSMPLSAKITIRTGLWGISTEHSREISTSKKELITIGGITPYYNVSTTSISGASYIDLPVGVYYNIHRKIAVGAGIQLSKILKINARKQVDSYTLGNLYISSTDGQSRLTPAELSELLPYNAKVAKLDSRLFAETSFRASRWLFTAGYYFNWRGNSIVLNQGTGGTTSIGNRNFKLGIQYRISRR